MKLTTLILTLTFSLSNLAATIEIKNLCDDSSYYQESFIILNDTTVGHITTFMLENAKIPFVGNENGINSILNTPTGLDAYEVLADDHMRVYGWCYSVNGKQPTRLISEYVIDRNKHDHIVWFYGFAEFKANKWTTYCHPVYKQPTSFICQ